MDKSIINYEYEFLLEVTRLNISSLPATSCLILMLDKDGLEIIFHGSGITYWKKKDAKENANVYIEGEKT